MYEFDVKNVWVLWITYTYNSNLNYTKFYQLTVSRREETERDIIKLK